MLQNGQYLKERCFTGLTHFNLSTFQRSNFFTFNPSAPQLDGVLMQILGSRPFWTF